MKDKLLKIHDDLDSIYEAYDNLQVLASSASVDSENVGRVLYVINQQFNNILNELENVRKGKTKLTVIKD